MKSPKQRFLEIKQAADRHRDTVDSTPFAVAMDMAILQVVWDLDLAVASDVQSAAANYWKLQGAMKYMKELESLGNVKVEKSKISEDNLIHTR